MAKFSDIKGFVFDLDGVITDTSVFHSKAWRQVADKVGAPWSKELEDGLKGISRMDSLEMILKAGNLQDKYTEDQKVALATEKNTNYLKLVDQMTPDNILPGIKAFLDEIKNGGYLLSLASASKKCPKGSSKVKFNRLLPKDC